MHGIGERVEQAENAGELWGLLEERRRHDASAALEHTCVQDPDLLLRLVDEGGSPAALLANPRLRDAALVAVLERTICAWEGGSRLDRGALVRAFLGAGRVKREPWRARLFRLVDRGTPGTRAVALRVLAAWPALVGADIEHLWAYATDVEERARVLAHPAASVRLCRTAVGCGAHIRELRAIATHREVRAENDIRRVLREAAGDDGAICRLLCVDGRVGEIDELLPRLARQNVRHALDVMATLGRERLGDACRRQLALALSHEERDVRLAAQRVLGCGDTT